MVEILAFSAEHVRRLTGLSDRQLRYWDKTNFFTPHYVDELKRRPFGRIYSFRDVVGLRAIAMLRKKYGIPLQELRKVGAWLRERYETPWSALRFYVAGGHVYFQRPEFGQIVPGLRPDQAAMPIEMQAIAEDVERQVERLQQRRSSDYGKIVRNRYVAHNAPVLAGTRISTESIWNLHTAGYSTQQIIEEYPRLSPADVRAAIDYERRRRSRRAG